MNLYDLHIPKKQNSPLILSIPHSGTFIPDEIKSTMKKEVINTLDDTDWYIPKLYNFIYDFDVPVIQANYHRYVVDLNRDPTGVNLYNDGRIITQVVPEHTFTGERIYCDEHYLSSEEKEDRVAKYFIPYHEALRELINSTVKKFGMAFLWDAHSIKRHVKQIHPKEFPDFIAGTFDGKSCYSLFTDLICNHLSLEYHLEKNTLFKGGYITRKYGNPENHIHAFQLEMSKDLYMDDSETHWDDKKAKNIADHFQSIFNQLTKVIT